MQQMFDADKLRPAELICEADPRSNFLVRVDRSAGTSRPITVADHHGDVAQFVLHTGVPEDVAMQFETARNLYLYSWFVYRFYPVAEHQSLACLELALRGRLANDIKNGKINYPGKKPTLHPLLKYAIDQKLIRNEGFSRWRNRGTIRSRARVQMEKFMEMTEKGLTEISWDESEIKITAEDLNWDYVETLLEMLPELRNDYAHGSTELHNWALRSIEIVCEIINQLYPEPS